MSVSTVVTMGFGLFGNMVYLPTIGYGDLVPITTGDGRIEFTIPNKRHEFTIRNSQLSFTAPDKRSEFTAQKP